MRTEKTCVSKNANVKFCCSVLNNETKLKITDFINSNMMTVVVDILRVLVVLADDTIGSLAPWARSVAFLAIGTKI